MRRLAALLLGLLCASTALADAQPLRGPDILQALGDATAEGTWHGTPYRQFFAADGRTFYRQGDAPMTQGRWKVDGDRYCSDWSPPELGQPSWSCYAVLAEGATYFWQQPGDQPQPFTLSPGNGL